MTDDKPIYSVLYFEDTPGNFDVFARMKYNLDIQYVSTASEGITLLQNNPHKWDAIILDAMMPYDDGGTASIDSLLKVEKKISNLSGDSIPYFVYSAHAAKLKDILPKEPWQAQSVFDKADSNSADNICINIRTAIVDNRSINAITKRKYPEITAIAKLDCNAPTESDLINIIRNLEVPVSSGYDPNRNDSLYNCIRVILEWVCRYLYSKRLFTVEPTTTTPSASGRQMNFSAPSINDCSRAIGTNKSIPTYIQRSFHSLSVNCNEGSHGTDIRQDTKNGVCPYAIKTTIYDLLNILHWLLTI